MIEPLTVLFVFVISFVMPDGTMSEPVDIVYANYGSLYCYSQVACLLYAKDLYSLDNDTIWVNVNHMYLTDDCGRFPLQQEILHFKYPNINIHNECAYR